MQRVVVVLEDAPERVMWLKEQFPGDLVSAHTTVRSFLVAVGAVTPDLVILDHDLGMCDSKTGLDAASGITTGSPFPVVVWSVNPIGAKCIAHALFDKKVACVTCPFLHPHDYLADLIGALLASSTA